MFSSAKLNYFGDIEVWAVWTSDLETVFSGSDGQFDLLPGLLIGSRLSGELPHLGLRAQHAVNHPDGQLSCSTHIKIKTKKPPKNIRILHPLKTQEAKRYVNSLTDVI